MNYHTLIVETHNAYMYNNRTARHATCRCRSQVTFRALIITVQCCESYSESLTCNCWQTISFKPNKQECGVTNYASIRKQGKFMVVELKVIVGDGGKL